MKTVFLPLSSLNVFIHSNKPFFLHRLSWPSPSSIPWDHSVYDLRAIYVKLDINYTVIKSKWYIQSKGNDRSPEAAKHIQDLRFLGFLKHGNISPMSPWMNIEVAGLKAQNRTETLASCPFEGRSPTWLMNGSDEGSREALGLTWSLREPLEGRSQRPMLVFGFQACCSRGESHLLHLTVLTLLYPKWVLFLMVSLS